MPKKSPNKQVERKTFACFLYFACQMSASHPLAMRLRYNNDLFLVSLSGEDHIVMNGKRVGFQVLSKWLARRPKLYPIILKLLYQKMAPYSDYRVFQAHILVARLCDLAAQSRHKVCMYLQYHDDRRACLYLYRNPDDSSPNAEAVFPYYDKEKVLHSARRTLNDQALINLVLDDFFAFSFAVQTAEQMSRQEFSHDELEHMEMLWLTKGLLQDPPVEEQMFTAPVVDGTLSD